MYSPQSLASIILKISLLLLFSNSLCTGIRFEKECSSQNPLIRDENTRATVPIGDESGRFQVLVSDPGYSPGEQKLVSVTMSNEVSEQINAFLMSAFDRNDNLVGQWSARLSDGSKWRVANCGGSGNVFVVEEWPSHEIPIAVWTPGSSTQGPITIRAVVVTERDRRAYNVRPIRLQPRTNILSTVSLEECGTSKGCYLVPANCKSRDCQYVLTWATIGDSVHYELSAHTDGWVGVGFSEDNEVGNDQFIICTQSPVRSSSGAQARLMNTYLKAGDETPGLISVEDPLLGIDKNRHSAVYTRDHITCAFSRKKSPPDGHHREIKDLHKPHYILATFGSAANMVNGMPNLVHPAHPYVTDRRVDFNKEANDPRFRSGRTGSWLAKVHGSLMIIAWVLLASIAMLTSRYYRPMWITAPGGVERQGKYFWISVYQPLILSVAVLSVIALVFILFELNWTWPGIPRYLWHSILGIVVICLAVVNVAMSFCVPRHNGKGYCLWFWVHWIVSSLAHCLAIPVIFLGMDQPRMDLWDWCSWLLLAWCIFHILTDLILEIHYCMTYRKSYERFEEIPQDQAHYRHKGGYRSSRSGSWRNSPSSDPEYRRRRPPPGYQWKPFCLGFYVIVTLFVVLALIVAIILYD